MINQRLFEKILFKHSKTLKNKDIKHKKFAICFSGIPASGKTTLAKLLEKRYSALKLNKDDIGEIIINLNITKNIVSKENLVDEYIYHLLRNFPFQNNLIILDKSIDRQYKEIFKILDKNRFEVFVIRINIKKEDTIKRIKERNKENSDIWLAKIEKWFLDFENSKLNVKSDFEFNNKKDLKNLFSILDRKI